MKSAWVKTMADWTELMVICDNCGHAIHVKRTDSEQDVVEVVRCKDCKWSEIQGKTTRYYYCDYHEFNPDPNDFCSAGERKDG